MFAIGRHGDCNDNNRIWDDGGRLNFWLGCWRYHCRKFRWFDYGIGFRVENIFYYFVNGRYRIFEFWIFDSKQFVGSEQFDYDHNCITANEYILFDCRNIHCGERRGNRQWLIREWFRQDSGRYCSSPHFSTTAREACTHHE